MKSDKNQSPAPKVSSQPKGDYTGKWCEPAEEFLEVGPSRGISPENNEDLQQAQTPTQRQEKKNSEDKD